MALWKVLLRGHETKRLKKVSITLHGLRPATEVTRQPELFDHDLHLPDKQRQKRREQLSQAMDDLNGRFGRDTVTMGGLPIHTRSFSGTKIAFTRIPEQAEFHE